MVKRYMYLSIRNRKHSVLVFMLAMACPSFAQFDVNSYLAQSTSALEMQVIQAQQSYLKEGKFTSPFLREIEFRVRTRDIVNLTPDDYRFRLSPLNPYERRANKEHLALTHAQLTSQQLVDFSDILARRYDLLIQLRFIQQMQEIERAESERYAQLIRASSHRVDQSDEIILLDKRLLFNKLQRDDIASERVLIENLIREGSDVQGPIDLSSFEWVRVEQIEEDINISANPFEFNIYVQNEANKARLSESDVEINRQESFGNIGYVQAEYRTYRGETFNENFGLQLGFQLPFVNPDRPDLERRQLDLIEDQFEVKEMQREIDLRLFSLENDLKKLISQHHRITAKLDSFDRFNNISFSNVKALIELEDYRNDLNRRKLEVYNALLTAYIEWLQYKGWLTSSPYVNYLTAEKVTFGGEG